jgi:23S rRNA (guanosine2251-2'-O)-methyltransferase
MFNYRSLDDLLGIARAKNEPPFLLILDGIEDPHNFGAILRTAEAAGVHGVIIRKVRQVPVTETVHKVSTGAADKVPVARVPNIAEAIRALQKEDLVVIGVEIDGKRLYNQADLGGPLALVIGSEGSGLSRLVKERCSEVVRIPMRGTINSLNASVATGIALFEVLRQRADFAARR